MSSTSKPLFILFPGFCSSVFWWQWETTAQNELKRHSFIDNLSKMGLVYACQYKFANIEYYRTTNKKFRDKVASMKNPPYTSDLNFTFKDLDFKTICEQVRADIKRMYGNMKLRMIPIGHSYGGGLACMFSKMYAKECSFMLLIDSVHLLKSINKEYFEIHEKKKVQRVTNHFKSNDDLQMHLKNVMIAAPSQSTKLNLIEDLIDVRFQMNFVKYLNSKLDIPTIIFRSIVVNPYGFDRTANEWTRQEQEALIKKNKIEMCKFRYLLDAKHSIWHTETHGRDILDEIKMGLCCYFE